MVEGIVEELKNGLQFHKDHLWLNANSLYEKCGDIVRRDPTKIKEVLEIMKEVVKLPGNKAERSKDYDGMPYHPYYTLYKECSNIVKKDSSFSEEVIDIVKDAIKSEYNGFIHNGVSNKRNSYSSFFDFCGTMVNCVPNKSKEVFTIMEEVVKAEKTYKPLENSFSGIPSDSYCALTESLCGIINNNPKTCMIALDLLQKAENINGWEASAYHVYTDIINKSEDIKIKEVAFDMIENHVSEKHGIVDFMRDTEQFLLHNESPKDISRMLSVVEKVVDTIEAEKDSFSRDNLEILSSIYFLYSRVSEEKPDVEHKLSQIKRSATEKYVIANGVNERMPVSPSCGFYREDCDNSRYAESVRKEIVNMTAKPNDSAAVIAAKQAQR